jgi:YesN/AraC family two-component response regulator
MVEVLEWNIESVYDVVSYILLEVLIIISLFYLLIHSGLGFHMVQKELFVLIAIVHRKQKAVGLEERELLPDIMNTEYIEANTIYDVKRELFSACMEIRNALKEQREHRMTAELAQMQLYIEEKIWQGMSGEITLSSVADQFNKNPNYLSKIFSEGIGTNFKDYVINLKLVWAEKATHIRT